MIFCTEAGCGFFPAGGEILKVEGLTTLVKIQTYSLTASTYLCVKCYDSRMKATTPFKMFQVENEQDALPSNIHFKESKGNVLPVIPH